ncbi:MAG: hypothetical protein ACREDD_13400 [Methylocella sp.]
MRNTTLGLAFASMVALSATPSFAIDNNDNFSFNLVVSSGAKACTNLSKNAFGHATIAAFPPSGPFEKMHVELFNMPPNSDFVIFIIQVPNKPFGLAWYDGDILTDDDGHGVTDIIGRFSTGTFIVSPGAVPSVPSFPDDSTTGVKTAPVQLYHVGIWFNSVAEANAAGCPPNVVTPFTSNHQAGIQVLNTSNFPDNFGPLLHVQ